MADIPSLVLAAIADQVQVPASAFAQYGEREHTIYEHLDEIRRTYGLRECRWREYLWLVRQLLVHAMESDRPVPLIEQALELLRTERIIAVLVTEPYAQSLKVRSSRPSIYEWMSVSPP